MDKGGEEVKPKYNLYSAYPQFNYVHPPVTLEWVYDGSGKLDVFVDDYIKLNQHFKTAEHRIAILMEPRTIQPTVYEWIKQHSDEFDIIFSHDEKILKLPNARVMYFMNWYESFDEHKTKNISMVCSDKQMCSEHKQRQQLADLLGDKVDHYGGYKKSGWDSYYDCRAEYRFEVVVDNNWTGYWISEKLANPLASKTIPIYLGGKHFPDDIDTNGIIIADSIDEIPELVDEVLANPIRAYMDRQNAVERNYNIIRRYKIFEDWLFGEYKELLEGLS